MEIRGRCHNCNKEYIADQPEGKTSAWFTCDCGQTFGNFIIIEPYGKVFLYGIAALRRKRFSNACIQFATSFEVFQKQFAEILLKNAGVNKTLSRFLVYDLDLQRGKYSQLARFILHDKLKHPDVSLRNSAVHFGRVPKKEKVITLAEEVIEAINVWISAAEKRTGIGYQALMNAWMKAEELSQDYSEFERSIFDLRTAYFLIKDQWSELPKE